MLAPFVEGSLNVKIDGVWRHRSFDGASQHERISLLRSIVSATGQTAREEGGAVAGSLFQGAPLFGRDEDLELLHAFVDRSSSDGDALLLSGAPGVGKSVLLDAVAAHGAGAGVRVLRGAGAEFEADLSFAGLNQVLHPLFDDIEGLSPTQRAALEVALGLGDGPAPDPLVVCNAGLSLLVKAASKEPLLVIVDDLQWVDRASALVLGFVARRLHGTRVGFLAAFRSGDESFFERSGLRGHDLGPLDDTASTALLADRFPALAPRVRQRLLAEAQGNPLALWSFQPR